MPVPGRRALLATVLVAVLVVGSLGLGLRASSGPRSPVAPTSRAAQPPTLASAQPATSPLPGPAVAAAPTDASNAASRAADAALGASRAAGVRPNVAFVPRPSATAAELASARETGLVAPLYSGTPAPMGLAYYGLRAGPGGEVLGSILNTTRLVATVDLNATGVRAADLFQSSPDSFGIQLNAVVTNITLFGTAGYAFWTQNVVEYYPGSDFLDLVSNVWNFSSATAAMTSNDLYSHGANGTDESGLLGYYYAQYAVPSPVRYPFDLTLFLNSTITDGRDAVDFTVHLGSVADPSENFTAPYDYVVFNSLAAHTSPLAVPSNYTANGLAYNAMGLTNDFELIFGGPGGGSQATLADADATLGLATWDGSAYVSVPSAYSYGGETGETVTGANVAWSNGAGGPFSTYGTMTTGPSILTGLWNATAPEGSYPVTLDVTPANAFVLVGPHDWPQNFTVAEMAVVPAGSPETIYLAPGNYSWQTVLSDYASASATVDVVGPTTVNVSLTSDPALGIYTPLWAFSNSELAALSTSGNGTPSSPYVIENVQSRPIVAPFGLYNDFGFPAYPAVFLANTNATTEFDDPPSFSTVTDVATPGAGRSLPYVNDLQYWFWNASNVAVVNATNISGWFAASTYYPAAFNTFSVVFYEGGHDLVAGDTFDSEGQGLLLFSGGSFFGPLNVGGGNSTVWGDRFVQVPAPNSTLELLTESTGLGLEVAEANDLVYDNDVDTPTTAWLVPMNLYSGAAEFFQDSFNITREPASAVRYASGFPFEPLTGSIAGTSYQGGNFWWDYGIASNPFNGADDPYDLLPYEERGVTPLVGYGPAYYSATYIYPGGDYLPLTTVALYPVVIRSAGLPDGLSWGANLSLRNGTPVDYPTANGTSAVAYLPNGSYSGSAVPPVGWAGSGPRAVKFSVAGAGTSLTLSFRLAKGFRPLTFAERGLAKGTPWSVTLNGLDNGGSAPPVVNLTETSVGRKLVFAVVASAGYAYAAAPVGGYTLASPSHGSVDPAGGRTVVHLEFVPVTYTVTFTETGLPNGTLWKVSVDGRTYSSKGASIAVQLPNGTSAFTVRPAQGYQPSPHTGAVTVAAGPTSVSITYAKR